MYVLKSGQQIKQHSYCSHVKFMKKYDLLKSHGIAFFEEHSKRSGTDFFSYVSAWTRLEVKFYDR